jgi:hypothetical protein
MGSFLDWITQQMGTQGLTPPPPRPPDAPGPNPLEILGGLAGTTLGEIGGVKDAPMGLLNADQALATALAGAALTSAFRGQGLNLGNSAVQGGRAFVSRLQSGGPAAAMSGAQHDWETTPDPGAGQINLGGPFAPGLPLVKGLASAPLDPASYVGGPAGRALGKGAELVGPATPLGRALLQGQAANVAFADAAHAATEGAKSGLGAVARHLPIAGKLFQESGASTLRGTGEAATDVAANLGRLAEQGVAPAEAAQPWRYLAGPERPPGGAPPAAPLDLQGALGITDTTPLTGAQSKGVQTLLKDYTQHAWSDMGFADSAYTQLGLDKGVPVTQAAQQTMAATPEAGPALHIAVGKLQAATPGKPLTTEMVMKLLDAELENAAARTGEPVNEAARWAGALDWLAQRYGDGIVPNRNQGGGGPAAAAARIARERGAEPLHPALSDLGLTPEAAPAVQASPAGPPTAPAGTGTPPPAPSTGPAAAPQAPPPARPRREEFPPGQAGEQAFETSDADWLYQMRAAAQEAKAPAGGIPMGRARIDRAKLQEGLDMGLTRDQAMDRARVGIDMGAPSAGEPGLPPTAAAGPEAPGAAPLAAAPPVGPAGAALSEAVGPSGRTYQFRYRVADLNELIPSHTDAFTPNPAYPAEIQPRQRDRGLAQLQVGQIARDLRPEPLLMPSPELDRGPMIVGPDNLVESGNGRVLAMRQAAQQYPEQAQAYQAALRQNLAQYGLSEADLAGKAFPVLVRERVTPLTPAERVAFAAEANQRTTLGMGTAEQAASDAQAIPTTALQGLELRPGQSLEQALQAPANRPFVGQFMGRLPPTEQAGLVDAQGQLSQAGLDRVASALFARVYEGDVGQRLTYAFRESLDPTILNLQRALQDTLPAFARLKGTEYDLAPDLAPAVDVLARLRQANLPVAQYLGQASMFDRELTPFQEQILGFLDANLKNRARLRDTLAEYGRLADAVPPPEQMGLFGAAPRPQKGELLDRAATTAAGAQGDLFASAEAATPAAPAPRGGLGAPPAAPDAAAAPLAPAPPTPSAPAAPAGDAALLAQEQALQQQINALPPTAAGLPHGPRDALMADLAAVRQQRMPPPTSTPSDVLPDFAGVERANLSGAPSLQPEGPLGGMAAPTPAAPMDAAAQAARGTAINPALTEELTNAQRAWKIVDAESADPLERVAARQRVTAAEAALDDALKASLGMPTSTAQPDVLGAATTKSAAQAAAAQAAQRQMWLEQAANQAGASPDLLAQMQRDAPSLVQQFTKGQQTWQDILARLPGDTPPATLRDAYAQAQAATDLPSTVQTKLVSDIRGLIRTFGAEVDPANPAHETDALTAAFVTGRAKAMAAAGERTTPLTLPVLGTLMNVIRKLALFNLGMPIKYVTDALLHSAAFAGKGIPDLGETAIRAVKTGEEAGLGPVAAQWFIDRGISPPQGLSRGQVLAQNLATQTPPEVGAETPGLASRAADVVAGLPDQIGIPERAQNAGAWLKNVTEALTRTLGTTARAGGFMEGYDRYMAQNADALGQRFTTLLGEAAAPIRKALAENKGVLTAQALGTLLEEGGVQDLASAQQALGLLGGAQRAAKQAGMQMADRYSLGTSTLTNADEIAANFIPFHVFASRSLPIMLEMFSTNPKLYVLYQQYYDALTAYDAEQGILPGTRLAQRLPVWHTPLGTVYFDPLSYTAESRLFKKTYPSPKMTELGQKYQEAERLGFGLAQPWMTLAEMSGQLGARPPAGVTEADPLIGLGWQALTGNVAPPFYENWGNLRPFGAFATDPQHIAPGETAYDPATPVRKRLAEMSIERTGQVNNPEYVQAAMTPGSPLFQQAARDVALRNLLEMGSHTLGVPIEHRTDAQANIERAMAGLPLVNAAGGGQRNPLYPTLPYPTGPLDPAQQVTSEQHQQALIARAQTNPYALGYQMAFGGGEPPADKSPYSKLREDAIRAYTQGSASERAAVLADPRKWGFVQDYLLHQSPIFHPQMPGQGAPAARPFLQDILGVP